VGTVGWMFQERHNSYEISKMFLEEHFSSFIRFAFSRVFLKEHFSYSSILDFARNAQAGTLMRAGTEAPKCTPS